MINVILIYRKNVQRIVLQIAMEFILLKVN